MRKSVILPSEGNRKFENIMETYDQNSYKNTFKN